MTQRLLVISLYLCVSPNCGDVPTLDEEADGKGTRE